jgi:regulator of replication initiation timing
MTILEQAQEIIEKLDGINTLVREIAAQRDTLKLEKEALSNRLDRIKGLAQHAIKAKPADLEETWFRVEQIATSEDG